MEDKLKGKLKETEGKLTGDDSEEMEGKLQEKKGNLESHAKGVMHDIEHAGDDRPENA